METPKDKTVVLEGEAAVNLWLDGEDAWNEWVAENPDAKVDFSRIDFSIYGYVFFAGFHFPTGNGGVTFERALFGDGGVNFENAKFGDDGIFFFNASFGKGDINFSNSTFGSNGADFSHVKFGGGDVSFSGVSFGKGKIDFSHATCGTGHFAIKECSFGNGKDKPKQKGAVTFEHIDFGGRFSFQNCKETGNIQSLSFKGCVFKAGVTLAVKLSCVPDLRGTIVTAHIDLEELQVNSKSRAIEDAPKYRRLKELAERNRHHEAALRFFAGERCCMRWARGDKPWQTVWSYLASVLDVIYAGACDYGRSIAWPVGWLGGLISGSTAVLVNCFKIPLWLDALPMVLTSSIPFLPAGRVSATEHQWAGDVGHLLPYFELWFLGHQFFSFILLFLIGIGLRNRFRLKPAGHAVVECLY